MRVIVQRVSSARVEVNGEVVGNIGKGMMALVGIGETDLVDDMKWTALKLANVRLFPDDKGRQWARSCKDLGYDILMVSQFTLQHTMKGNKPDYHRAMGTEAADEMFGQLVETVREVHSGKVETGTFGAHMDVHLVNDGPVTLILDSRNRNNAEVDEPPKKVKIPKKPPTKKQRQPAPADGAAGAAAGAAEAAAGGGGEAAPAPQPEDS